MRTKMVSALLGITIFTLSWGPTLALTPEQVAALKKAGVEEETIRLMIRQEKAARGQEMGVKEIRDGEGNVMIIYTTGPNTAAMSDVERQRVDRAWELLKRIIVDHRR
ncbi:MAG: hypothetical protein N2Z74_07005 [Syntrophales bacterium]|nr:hypothetical protein [Syntrophales bacterium]